jgi:hypothetical protein
MPYTVWLHGKQIGETKFELPSPKRKLAGTLHPTEIGLRMLPAVTAMAPALFAFGDMCRRKGLTPNSIERQSAAKAREIVGETPEGQRLMAAAEQVAAVEVRDPDGRVIEWESLAITDIDWLVSYAHRLENGEEPREKAEGKPPAPDPIKFMISLTKKKKPALRARPVAAMC